MKNLEAYNLLKKLEKLLNCSINNYEFLADTGYPVDLNSDLNINHSSREITKLVDKYNTFEINILGFVVGLIELVDQYRDSQVNEFLSNISHTTVNLLKYIDEGVTVKQLSNQLGMTSNRVLKSFKELEDLALVKLARNYHIYDKSTVIMRVYF